jgi:diguanylate cyclase
MRFRVTSFWHVLGYALASCAFAVAVPTVVLRHMLPWLPEPLLFGTTLVVSIIVVGLTLPLSLLALNAVRRVNMALAQLDLLVRFDPLTGTLSRSQFLLAMEQGRKAGSSLALLDADRFKSINDVHGHEAGDFALKHLAQAISSATGAYGIAGRLGGEEFAVYFPGVPRAQARLLLANLSTCLRTGGFTYGGAQLWPTFSMGLVEDDGESLQTSLIRRADTCLYAAKHRGRDCCVTEDELTLDAGASAAA